MWRESVSLLSLVLAACVSPVGSEDSAAETEERLDGAADAARDYPFGTWWARESGAPFEALALASDRTFSLHDKAGADIAGTFRFTRSGNNRYVRLTADDGTDAGRFAWSFAGADELVLRIVDTTTTSRFGRAKSWNANEVSILFPHPEEGDESHLLAMQEPTASGERVLLPRAVFAQLGAPGSGLPRLIEGAGHRDVYDRLRVTAARIDPCFDGTEPCRRQIRLAAQVLYPIDGSDDPLELSDASIHLFYSLDDAAFGRLLGRLAALGREQPIDGPLGVHPGLRAAGVGSAYAERLRAAILEACSETNLTRFTFMATGRSRNWFFFTLEPDGGVFRTVAIPGVDEGFGDSFSDFGQRGFRMGVPMSKPWFPDALTDTEATRALSGMELASALDQLAEIANPDLVRTADVNCGSCHVVDPTRAEALADRMLDGFDPLPSEFESTAPPPAVAPPGHGNLHAFSWFFGTPTISRRTAHETELVVRALESPSFLASLDAETRALLLSPSM